MIVGALVSTFATNWQIYMGGRMVLGFGNSFAQMCSPILLTEICHPQHRAKFTAVYNCLWNLGALFVAFIGWGTSNVDNEWSWRSITLLQGFPSLLQICFIYWVPESPRVSFHSRLYRFSANEVQVAHLQRALRGSSQHACLLPCERRPEQRHRAIRVPGDEGDH